MQTINLFRDGVLVDLDIGYYRGHAKLRADEVELKEKDAAGIVKLGHKEVLPEGALDAVGKVEQGARTTLNGKCHVFPIGNLHFCAAQTVEGLEKALTELRASFEDEKDAFLAAYEGMRDEMLKKYPGLLHAEDYPPLEKVADSFYFSWHKFVLSPMQGESLDNVAEAFLKDVVAKQRAEVKGACDRALAKLAEGKVSETNLKTLRGVIAAYREKNFVKDEVTEAMLQELEDALKLVNAQLLRDNQDAAANVRRVIQRVREAVQGDGEKVVEEYKRVVRPAQQGA